MPPRALAERLKALAREAGAELAGIAPVDPPVESEYFQSWLDEGRQGSMAYLAKETAVRTDLRKWYGDARSVLVCAFPYSDGKERPAEGAGPQGRLARYATLPDYHPLLKEALGWVLEAARLEAPTLDGRVFVDSSPVLEKAFARWSGIGWMGKNTMLIHPRLGSYFFLAGIALNTDLPADSPVTDHCGTCTRCLDACPTDAFPAPHQLDASKCIAYFTIEHRGPIPEPYRERIGDWVFGCDVCQDVCPWNKFAAAPRLPEWRDRAEPTHGLLRTWLKMTPEQFKPLKKTPIERARWKGWIRNLLLAAGNSGDRTLAGEIEAWAADEDPAIAEQARWSLSRLRRPAR